MPMKPTEKLAAAANMATENKVIRLAGISENSLVNGKGLRKVYFCQGCRHACKNCFNQETWDFNGGKLFNIDDLLDEIGYETYLDGVTFSGGDPIEQADKLVYMAKAIKSMGFNIWCYTGYTWEQLLENSKSKPYILEFLKNIDVLVDGRFIEELKDDKIKYRGSTNQRLIDVQNSLNSNSIKILNL